MKKILVTGGTSYIGKHCIAQLVEKEYDVVATIRDISKSESILSDLNQYLNKEVNVTFFEADLLKDEGWNEAIQGCDAIIHLAGPYPMNFSGNEEDQIQPHTLGTLKILNLAKSNDINRVILVSSVAATWMGVPGDKDIDETKWTNENLKHLDAYVKSKTLKEKAAWDFVAENKSIKLTTILPPWVLGPGIGNHLEATSFKLFNALAKKEMPVAPPLKFGLVDVRDVAKMHIAALENDDSIGKRIIVAENTYWAKEVAQKLVENGYDAPTFTPPAFIVKFLARFDATLKGVSPIIGLDYKINSDRAKTLLGYSPIPIDKTFKDTISYIKATESS